MAIEITKKTAAKLIHAYIDSSQSRYAVDLIVNSLTGDKISASIAFDKALKIRDKVKFLGVRNDIPIQIAKASILGSTSKIESFGLTIAEAMSCETPVIAPNVGGIPEICVNNENGNLYESGNLVDGTNKLRDLIEDEDKRRRYGENSRKRILDKFTPEIIVKKYIIIKLMIELNHLQIIL